MEKIMKYLASTPLTVRRDDHYGSVFGPGKRWIAVKWTNCVTIKVFKPKSGVFKITTLQEAENFIQERGQK